MESEQVVENHTSSISTKSQLSAESTGDGFNAETHTE